MKLPIWRIRALTILSLLAVAGTAVQPLPAAAETSFSTKIDFGDQATAPAAGYRADYGQAYGARSGPNQGSGLTYGWVRVGTSTPVDFVGNGRNRNPAANEPDQRLATLMHMQLPDGSPGVRIPGSWEIAVPNGTYAVTVAVGDPTSYNSVHSLQVEDQNAVDAFKPTSTNKYRTVTLNPTVTDGRLTVSPAGGTNTKLSYITIDPLSGADARPQIRAVTPGNTTTGVPPTTSIVADLRLVNGGVDAATLSSSTVTLTNATDGTPVATNVLTSGGGDVINVSPTAPLAPNTRYRFVVTSAVKDTAGNPFVAWNSVFTTGDLATPGTIAFDKVASGPSGRKFTSLTKGPDGKLYAATLDGYIERYTISADGTLTGRQTISTVRDNASAQGLPGAPNRTVIGLAFDPASTAANPILWVSTNTMYNGESPPSQPDWSSRIATLSGPNLSNYRDVITNLPRSNRDHETNSLAFGPDNALYIAQGSNNAMGAPDAAWGDRPERLLSAAILRLDPGRLPQSLPVDVRTEAPGTYDPFAANAPLTLYATGVRNAYDLVWHSNGHLYTPTNGSAAGGNTPATSSPLPGACANRIDMATAGPYTGPSVPAVTANPAPETDYVFDVKKGRYYGHPNPSRCEWALAGANPTASTDPFEVAAYPVGTQPDRNLALSDIYDAGLHASADGVIEYQGNAFGGALKGKLLVVRYSDGQDIQTFDVSPTGRLSNRTTGITGFTGFQQPLDLTEDTATGNLYVTEMGSSKITLLRPRTGAGLLSVANVNAVPFGDRLAFSRIGTPADAAQKVRDTGKLRLGNTGTASLAVTGLPISGPWTLDSPPTLPVTIPPGGILDLTVRFTASGTRANTGSLTIQTDSPSTPAKVVQLAGFWQSQSEGGHEPSVREIAATMGNTTDIPTDLNQKGHVAPVGDEVISAYWTRSNGTKPVTVTQLNAYHSYPAGATVRWFARGSTTRTTIASHSSAWAQSLLPARSSGGLTTGTFSPDGAFGFAVDGETSDATKNDQSADLGNGCPGPCGQHVRFFPVKDRQGAFVPGTYYMIMDYSGINYDYNDNGYLVTNIAPASP